MQADFRHCPAKLFAIFCHIDSHSTGANHFHIVFFQHAFTVEVETADNGVSLDAEAHGVPAGRLEKTIKAATFSGLSIESQESSWSASIVFDV